MIYYGTIPPGSPVALLARVSDDTGAPITMENVEAISVVVTDMMADVAGSPLSVDPTVSVHDTMQTAGWTIDGVGYNLSLRLDGGNFTTPRTTYQVVATITPANTAGGSAFNLVWELQTDTVL